MEEKKKLLRSKTPIQVLTKMFHKRKRNRSVNQPRSDRDSSFPAENGDQGFGSDRGGHVRQAKSNEDLLAATSYGDHMNEIVLIERELELLHMSRVDNPYLQVLSSQDHLDRGGGFSEVEFQPSISMDSPEALSSPARSHQGGHRTPMMLEEIHSHLVRSPPPVSWPVSPRSTGTFSPDSGTGDMTVSSGDGDMSASCTAATVIKRNSAAVSPPTIPPLANQTTITNLVDNAGINPLADRSQSFDYILSPCKELLRNAGGGEASSGGPAITCLSPTRGMTPEVLLANDSGYYGGGGGSLSQAASPRQQAFMSTSMGGGGTSDIWFTRQRSFHSQQQSSHHSQLGATPGGHGRHQTFSVSSTSASAAASGATPGSTHGSSQRRIPFYHTMSMYATTQTDDNCNSTPTSQLTQNSFSQSVLSPNLNQSCQRGGGGPVVRTASFSSSSILRRSFGRLPSVFSPIITSSPSAGGENSGRRSSSSHRGERMFSSWRKGSSGSGSRIRSKSSDTSAFLSSTNNDVEGGELDPGEPKVDGIADNSQETTGSQKERKRSKKSSFNTRAQKNFSTENLLGVEDRQKPTIRGHHGRHGGSGEVEALIDPTTSYECDSVTKSQAIVSGEGR